jgi:large subunit ribosomal protein L2
VLGFDGGFATIKLPSGEVRKVLENCFASVGGVSNDEHHLVNLGKAGRTSRRSDSSGRTTGR